MPSGKRKSAWLVVFFVLSLVLVGLLCREFSAWWDSYLLQRRLTEAGKKAVAALAAWEGRRAALPPFLLHQISSEQGVRQHPFVRAAYRLRRGYPLCREAILAAARGAGLEAAEKTIAARGVRRHLFSLSDDSGLSLVEIELVELTGPVLALVIDDLGYERGETLRRLLKLPFPVTVAVMPGLRYSEEAARRAAAVGHEVIVHMPMEAGKGRRQLSGSIQIKAGMDEAEVLDLLRVSLEQVPTARGLNNHQGSLVTVDRGAMRVILGELKRRGCYFLDSRTTRETVGAEVCVELGLPFTERAVFLDNEDYSDAIEQQLVKLERMALAGKMPVGIGHPRKNTIDALAGFIPRLEAKGIHVLYVSEVLRY